MNHETAYRNLLSGKVSEVWLLSYFAQYGLCKVAFRGLIGYLVNPKVIAFWNDPSKMSIVRFIAKIDAKDIFKNI